MDGPKAEYKANTGYTAKPIGAAGKEPQLDMSSLSDAAKNIHKAVTKSFYTGPPKDEAEIRAILKGKEEDEEMLYVDKNGKLRKGKRIDMLSNRQGFEDVTSDLEKALNSGDWTAEQKKDSQEQKENYALAYLAGYMYGAEEQKIAELPAIKNKLQFVLNTKEKKELQDSHKRWKQYDDTVSALTDIGYGAELANQIFLINYFDNAVNGDTNDILAKAFGLKTSMPEYLTNKLVDMQKNYFTIEDDLEDKIINGNKTVRYEPREIRLETA